MTQRNLDDCLMIFMTGDELLSLKVVIDTAVENGRITSDKEFKGLGIMCWPQPPKTFGEDGKIEIGPQFRILKDESEIARRM